MSFKVAIFSLNQWALDFTGNTKRIIKSIDLAYESRADLRSGPELEVCGYSLEDAFFETDTVYHSWMSLIEIVEHSSEMDMIIDIGMPVHFNSLYNCRVIIYSGRILCIRAKTSLAKEGNYREDRHFIPWSSDAGLTPFRLPDYVSRKINQRYVPFGADFILEVNAIRIGWEICQELWDLKTVSSDLYQTFGCHLVLNGSGSYWELRKLSTVLDLVSGLSLRGGACYAFSNHVGCDGQRYVFYGRSCIFDRGQLVAMTATSSDIFREVQMISHTVDCRAINEYRAQAGIRPDCSRKPSKVLILDYSDYSMIDNSFKVLRLRRSGAILPDQTLRSLDRNAHLLPSLTIRFEQEIHLYVSLWLWDYLRRSKMAGFMMPLSGGLDSSVVATLVFGMCNHVHANLNLKEVQNYFMEVFQIQPDRIHQELDSPETICNRILRCSYLSTRYSSDATLDRARRLCKLIGAQFSNLSLQDIYSSLIDLLKPKNSASDEVGLLDQNLQARLRMTATYYLSGGDRIVLATGNVDEAIVGYLTKYDCSSADINPIGGLCKDDLKSYLVYCCTNIYSDRPELISVLEEIIRAPPSAELTGAEQRDEDEIGITYSEISVLGRVRKGIYACSGPLGAFDFLWRNRHLAPFRDKIRCLSELKDGGSTKEASTKLASLVKIFYQRYARNRHKLTVLTPSLHAETYSPDDNRFDHRHFLYAPWTDQFRCIDEAVAKLNVQDPHSRR